MDYWYLWIVVVVVIAGAIYVRRRGSTGKTIQDGDTINEVPVLFGEPGLHLFQSGKLLILKNDLVIIDDNNTEQLRVPINPALQASLLAYSPFDIPFWDITDNSGRTLRAKFKPWSFSLLFSANAVANLNEHLLQTINHIAGTEVVRVSTLAQPSLMRAFRFVPWIILTAVLFIFIFAFYRGNLI